MYGAKSAEVWLELSWQLEYFAYVERIFIKVHSYSLEFQGWGP